MLNQLPNLIKIDSTDFLNSKFDNSDDTFDFLHYIIYIFYSNAYIYPYLTYTIYRATTATRNFGSVDTPSLHKASIYTYFLRSKNTFLLNLQFQFYKLDIVYSNNVTSATRGLFLTYMDSKILISSKYIPEMTAIRVKSK